MAESSAGTVTAPRATTGHAIPILRVANLDASIEYYVERLGFTVDWRAGDGMASVSRDHTSIMLNDGDQGHAGTWLWTSTSDADALYAELQSRGARLRHPPTNYPWGSRECHVFDLDGHVLRFGSEAPPGEPMGEWLDASGRRGAPTAEGGWERVE